MKNLFMQSIFHTRLLRNDTDWSVYTSLLCSALLLLTRFTYTGTFQYRFLLWNIFLAYVPFLLSNILVSQISVLNNRFSFALICLGWMAMIPNSFYILTDLYHLPLHGQVPMWFDLLLILSFAWTGVLMGVISIYKMELFVKLHLGQLRTSIFILLIMWLIGFGIYLGRYMRFNSWDVLSDPVSLFSSLFRLLIDPVQNLNTWAMTFFFGAFLFVMYITLKKLSRAFHQ